MPDSNFGIKSCPKGVSENEKPSNLVGFLGHSPFLGDVEGRYICQFDISPTWFTRERTSHTKRSCTNIESQRCFLRCSLLVLFWLYYIWFRTRSCFLCPRSMVSRQPDPWKIIAEILGPPKQLRFKQCSLELFIEHRRTLQRWTTSSIQRKKNGRTVNS